MVTNGKRIGRDLVRRDVFIGIPIAGLLTYVYLALAQFVLLFPLRINEGLYPDLAWLFLLPVAGIVYLCFQWPFARWSAWPIVTVQPPRRPILHLVLLAIPICVAALILPGGLFNLIVESLPLTADDTGSFAILLPVFIPVWAALNEEIAIRGILQGRLQRYMPAWLAISITTSIFVCFHYGTDWFYREIPFYIALSLTSGIIAARSRSVLPSIALHLAVNVFGVILPLIAGPVHLINIPDLVALSLLFAGGASVYWFRRVLRSIPREPQLLGQMIVAVGTDAQVQSDASSVSTQ